MDIIETYRNNKRLMTWWAVSIYYSTFSHRRDSANVRLLRPLWPLVSGQSRPGTMAPWWFGPTIQLASRNRSRSLLALCCCFKWALAEASSVEIAIYDESRIHTIEMHVNPYLFIWDRTYISAPYTPIQTYITIQTNINLTPGLSKIMLFNVKSIGPIWTNSLQNSSVSSRPHPRPDVWVPKKSCPYHRQRPLNNNWCYMMYMSKSFSTEMAVLWHDSSRNIGKHVVSSSEDIHLSNPPGLERAHNLHFFQEESSSDVHSSPGILLNAPKA